MLFEVIPRGKSLVKVATDLVPSTVSPRAEPHLPCMHLRMSIVMSSTYFFRSQCRCPLVICQDTIQPDQSYGSREKASEFVHTFTMYMRY